MRSKPKKRARPSHPDLWQAERNATARSGKPKFLYPVLSIAALVMAIAILWLWWDGGLLKKYAGSALDGIVGATGNADLDVRDIVVEGRQYTGEKELLAALGVEYGSPMLGFSPEEASRRVMELPWVETVAIERKMPSTLIVRLSERQPMARWQHEGQTAVVDRNGKKLAGVNHAAPPFSSLPLIVGKGAPERAADLLVVLGEFPNVALITKAAALVSERRWNVYLHHPLRPQEGLLVKLPEDDLRSALRRLTELLRSGEILERDIVSLDLRLPDRHVLQAGRSTPAAETSPKTSGDPRQ